MLLGSFSSTSEKPEGFDSASIRDSSLRGVAKRDISRRIRALPQCLHTASTRSLTRIVSTLVRLRHFSH